MSTTGWKYISRGGLPRNFSKKILKKLKKENWKKKLKKKKKKKKKKKERKKERTDFHGSGGGLASLLLIDALHIDLFSLIIWFTTKLLLQQMKSGKY